MNQRGREALNQIIQSWTCSQPRSLHWVQIVRPDELLKYKPPGRVRRVTRIADYLTIRR